MTQKYIQIPVNLNEAARAMGRKSYSAQKKKLGKKKYREEMKRRGLVRWEKAKGIKINPPL